MATDPESSSSSPQISPAVRALRDALPGIHAWFSLADQERAVAAVRAVIAAEAGTSETGPDRP